jgi:glycosyltransferase involved in cell wall biosynthesis
MNKFIDISSSELKDVNYKYLLSIVIPIYNESENISNVLDNWDKELKKINIDYCFIIVNDGSNDNSLEIIKSLKYNIILINKHNSGHGRTIRIGYEYAVKYIKSEYILQIDGDGQCDPKYLKSFWQNRLDYDFILGVRTIRGDGILRKIISKISKFITSFISSIDLKDPNTPYRLFKLNTLKESLKLVNESFDIHNIALTYVIIKNKYRYKTIKIEFPNRIGGNSSINFIKIFQMGLNLVFELYFLRKRLKL